MKENKFNREWVKTAAIIFLSILLVLTFFSNTIMNMSLPEVSTQHIQYGTIKTQVRGNGTVIAQDSFSITTSSTREVLKVAVRQGDEVKKGDILLYLSEAESKELQTARDNYDNLNYEYTKLLIQSSGNSALEEKQLLLTQTQNDLKEAKSSLEKLNTAQEAIDKAEAEVKAAERAITKKQNEISELETDKNTVGYTPTQEDVILGKDVNVTLEQYTQASNQLNTAQEKIDAAQESLRTAKEKFNTAKAKYDKIKREYDNIANEIETPLETLKEQIKSSDREIEALERSIKYLKQDVYENKHNEELQDAHEKFKDAQSAYRKAKNEYETVMADPNATDAQVAKAKSYLKQMTEAMNAAFDAYDSILTDKEETSNSLEKDLAEKETNLKYKLEDNSELKEKLAEVTELDKKLNEIQPELDQSEQIYNAATSDSETAQAVYDNAVEEKEFLEKQLEKTRNGYKYIVYKQYQDKIDTANLELDAMKQELEDKNDALTDLRDENPESESTLKEQIKSLERQIVSIQKEIETAMADAGDTQKLNDLELKRKKTEIDRAAAQVEKLEKEYVTKEIVSPVNGIIEAVNISSGKETVPDEPLIEISLSENGYKMSMTATLEQAAKLRPGIAAEITSYIPYGTQITATLTNIKNDTANPQSRQKILEFTIDGDVIPNQQLSIAVGDKNASYESTVPNTAIREDSNGKYILVVDSKSTPISTRYIARRVDVKVVASDDTRSAITGEFDNYAYVVATSSKPINDKDQVKLVEN